VFHERNWAISGKYLCFLERKVSTHTQAWKKLPEKYLRTMVIPLVVHWQAHTNGKSNVHSTIFMGDIDKSDSTLHIDYIKDS
jgi:hypothetical protein